MSPSKISFHVSVLRFVRSLQIRGEDVLNFALLCKSAAQLSQRSPVGSTYEKRNENLGWESLGAVYDLTVHFVFKHTGL